MTETGELTRDDLVIDPDMEIDDDGCIVTAYVETWFDVDRKFGTHTVDDAETWINFYAKYNTESGELLAEYQIDRLDGSEWHGVSSHRERKTVLLDMMDGMRPETFMAVPCWNMSG